MKYKKEYVTSCGVISVHFLNDVIMYFGLNLNPILEVQTLWCAVGEDNSVQ
jgi:hypothetical protein